MSFKYKKVLLKENDNITVNELCAIIKRRVRIDQMNPEPQYTTAFNTLNASGNPAVAQAIESIMATGIASMQYHSHRVTATAWRILSTLATEEQITTEATTTTDKHTSIMETKMAEDTVTTTTAEDVTVEAFREVEEIIREEGQTSNETTEVIDVPKDLLHQ